MGWTIGLWFPASAGMTCGQCVQLEQRTHNNTITSNQIQGAAFTQGTQGGGGEETEKNHKIVMKLDVQVDCEWCTAKDVDAGNQYPTPSYLSYPTSSYLPYPRPSYLPLFVLSGGHTWETCKIRHTESSWLKEEAVYERRDRPNIWHQLRTVPP